LEGISFSKTHFSAKMEAEIPPCSLPASSTSAHGVARARPTTSPPR
jgi:hypothetical protein